MALLNRAVDREEIKGNCYLNKSIVILEIERMKYHVKFITGFT